VERCGVDASGSGKGTVVHSCEHGNEPSGSIKRQRISSLAEWLLASQGLSSMGKSKSRGIF
jgi:hypothetical protein